MNTRVITIARTVGSLGEEVAREVARRMDYRYVDYQIVQQAANDAGASPEAIAEAQQAPSLLTRLLETLARNPSMPETVWANPAAPIDSPLYTSADYRRFVEQVVTDIANQGGAVILGHSAQAVLRGRPDVLRALVTASLDHRVRRVMTMMGVDAKEAEKTVKRSDHERLVFMDRIYELGWLSPEAYDICLNTDHLNPEQAADLVIKAAELR